MAAITATVATTVASAAYSNYQQKKATKKAKEAGKEADRLSADYIAKAGSLADADILQGAQDASKQVGMSTEAARQRLAPFADTGAFRMASDEILGGADFQNPIAQSIAASSRGAVSDPRFFDTSGPVGDAIGREAMFAAGGAQPVFTNALLGAGQEELATAGDIGGISQRGFGTLADIVRGAGSQRASAFIGQNPQLVSLTQGGQDRRLLSSIAGTQQQTQNIENIAGLLGTLRGRGTL